MVWTEDAIVNLLARQRAQRQQVNPRALRPQPGDTYPLPKVDLPQSNPVDDFRRNRERLQQRLGVIGDTYSFIPSDQPSQYLNDAEDLVFRANKINSKIQKRLSNPKVKKVPFSYDVPVRMPVGVPVAGGKSAAPNMNQKQLDKYQAAIMAGKSNKEAMAIALGGKGGKTPQPQGNFGALVSAISGKESGGNYGAVNPDSGAMGKYQIMPGNIAGPGGWDMEILGRNITTQQFLSSPKLQEQIAQGKLKQYYNQYGPAGAAAAWYAGPGAAKSWQGNNAGQGAYPSVRNYVLAILKAMGVRP